MFFLPKQHYFGTLCMTSAKNQLCSEHHEVIHVEYALSLAWSQRPIYLFYWLGSTLMIYLKEAFIGYIIMNIQHKTIHKHSI